MSNGIVEVESIVVDIPMAGTVHGVHGALSVQRSVLVRVVAADGREGWGNVDPTPGYSPVSATDVHRVVRRMTPSLLGLDPFNVNAALGVMDREVADAREAKAAVEMALLDLKGKALGVSVDSLLGGRVRDEVTLNAWIGTVSPERAAAEAAEWLARGFSTAKVKLSGATEEGLARVAAVRDAVGDRMALRVDFNETLPPGEAVSYISRLEPYHLTLVEQPLPRDDVRGLAALRRAIRIPLMADESVTGPASLLEIIALGAADIVKVKVMKQGGLTRTKQMVDIAAAAGITCVLGHGFGLTLSTLAELAVAAACETVMPGCEAVGPLKMAADVVTEPLRLGAGVVRLPGRPGLGATVDTDALKRYRVDVS